MNDINKGISEENRRISHPLMEYYRHVYAGSRRWNGTESLKGKTVIVYMEQGFGDIIQFTRFVPLLQTHQECNVIVAIPPELERLYVKLGYMVHLKNDPNLPSHDYHVLSMTLPFFLVNELKTIGDFDQPYFRYYSTKDLSDIDGYKVGICWEGSPENKNNDLRSIPLIQFDKIRRISDKIKKPVRLFSLQKEMHNPNLLVGAENMELYGVEISDFLDTAELINSLDMVVSIDSAVLHLAGALGCPARLLLSPLATDGRFEKSWYQTVNVIRNNPKNPANWDYAFESLLEGLTTKTTLF